jgi:serine protease Do
MSHAQRNRSLALLAVLAAFIVGLGASTGIGLVADSRAASHRAPVTITSSTFVDIAKTLSPAVVNINSTRTVKRPNRFFRRFEGKGPMEEFGDDFLDRFFGGQGGDRPMKQKSLGSGFIIDRAGLILTNNHVVEKADDITVTLTSGKDYQAKVVGRDPSTDLALIQIGEKVDLPVAPLGDSEGLEVGEWVMAIGNPFGLKHTVTVGVVSAKGRTIGSGPYDDFIQTDASINPGNSGGPLINVHGEVVGINTAIIASGQGIGFAIPIGMARDLLPQLKSGKVNRGWMGVSIQELTPELAKSFGLDDTKGALIGHVMPNDPADKAGIKAGDVIVEFDGKPVLSSRELVAVVGATPPDKEVTVKLIREREKRTVTLVTSRRADNAGRAGQEEEEEEQEPASGEGALGLTVREITKELAQRYELEETSGILVTGISPGGPADEAGVRRGDIILEAAHKQVRDVKQFDAAVGKAKAGDVVLLRIRRQGTSQFVTVRITE